MLSQIDLHIELIEIFFSLIHKIFYCFFDLDILEKGTREALTNHSKALGKLPDFGSLAMSKCVLATLKDCNCGADLISLSSILSVLNTTTLLKINSTEL
ncbi:unnamed protein product [Rotaria sordida]|uniref:Uncharacterized protein n=1 Tax=Rotaria sordida TaxID=392033 RepID=A0A816GSI9_9BILA|nr:unnamed protein product [Rotaria sordida]CAF1676905.1 unnamed protein product [Rotaria sordida]